MSSVMVDLWEDMVLACGDINLPLGRRRSGPNTIAPRMRFFTSHAIDSHDIVDVNTLFQKQNHHCPYILPKSWKFWTQGSNEPLCAQTVNHMAMAHRIDEMESELRVQLIDNKRLKSRCQELEDQISRIPPLTNRNGSLLDSGSDYAIACDTLEQQKAQEILRSENDALRCKIRLLARAWRWRCTEDPMECDDARVQTNSALRDSKFTCHTYQRLIFYPPHFTLSPHATCVLP